MTPMITRRDQNGAVLLVALVMLLVLTLLAVSSMRGSTLEGRITANRAHDTQQQNAADAALRESEFRYYGPGNLIEKLEPNADNCNTENVLNESGVNKPCLIALSTEANLLSFVNNPRTLAGSTTWMDFHGIDAVHKSAIGLKEGQTARMNSIRIPSSNTEYGMDLEGKGTFYYLNTAEANDTGTSSTVYLQSTHANIYMGLNN